MKGLIIALPLCLRNLREFLCEKFLIFNFSKIILKYSKIILKYSKHLRLVYVGSFPEKGESPRFRI
jgi:hypothetical protein